MGASQRELGRYDEALAAFEKANSAGAALFGEYGEAAVYAAMKQQDKAFEHLEKAVQQGEFRVWDSLAICEYVVEVTGRGWPKYPQARAMAHRCLP